MKKNYFIKSFLGCAVVFCIIFALALLPEKVLTAYADESLISNLSISVSEDFSVSKNLLIAAEDFSPETESYNLGSVDDSSLSLFNGFGKLFYSFSAPDGVSVKVSHYDSLGAFTEKDITSAAKKWSSVLLCGKNTFTVTASKGTETKTYSFSVDVFPTLSSLSLSTGKSESHISPAFSGKTYSYSAKISSSVSSLTVSAEPFGKNYSLLYNGASENSVSASFLNEITVKVSGGSGENMLSRDYTVSLEKVSAETAVFITEPANATVAVYDSAGERIFPDSVGGKTYTGIFTDAGCIYIASRTGYAPKSGAVSSGTTNIALEKAGTALTNLSADWKNFRGSDFNMAITSAKTPSGKTSQLWSKSFGSDWDNAVGLPLIIDGKIYVMYGNKISKLSIANGAEIASAEMAEKFNWGYTPMTYYGGMLFLPLDNGTIQALNADTLESLWVYRDPLKGQSLSPIVYSDGYIYTGFWNGETQSASFVCLSVTDENPDSKTEGKTPVWKISQKGGYYWAGAVVVGDAVIFGSDDGETGFDGENAVLCSRNKYTGEIISQMNITGDQRSSIAYSKENGKIYFTTKCGNLYCADIDPKTGVLSDLISKNYDAQCTSTPIYYKSRLYFGIGSGISTSGSSGSFVCADGNSLEKIYSTDLGGYPQCSFLLSNAYESDSGKLLFYSSYNSLPGGVAMISTSAKADSALVSYIFEPDSTQYCISSLICDSSGNIYYKNDSGTLFALNGNKTSVEIVTAEDEIISEIEEAKPGETVTMSIPNSETVVSRAIFLALGQKDNVTLKLSGPYFYWYFNSDNLSAEPERLFNPWVVVSSSKNIANGYFPDKKVLSVTFFEENEIPGRAMLMLPRLSPYYESGALSSSAGAALYEYTRESNTDANKRFAFDSSWFAITVTELKSYLITESEAPVPSLQTAPPISSETPVIPSEQPEESSSANEPSVAEILNKKQYDEMADTLKASVADLRTLNTALQNLDEKYNSDMSLMLIAAVGGIIIVSAAAGTTVYLTMKRKMNNIKGAEK